VTGRFLSTPPAIANPHGAPPFRSTVKLILASFSASINYSFKNKG